MDGDGDRRRTREYEQRQKEFASKQAMTESIEKAKIGLEEDAPQEFVKAKLVASHDYKRGLPHHYVYYNGLEELIEAEMSSEEDVNGPFRPSKSKKSKKSKKDKSAPQV